MQQSNDEEAVSQGDVTQDEYSSDKSSDDEGMNVSFKELLPCPTISIPAVLKRALGYDEYLVTKKKVSVSLFQGSRGKQRFEGRFTTMY